MFRKEKAADPDQSADAKDLGDKGTKAKAEGFGARLRRVRGKKKGDGASENDRGGKVDSLCRSIIKTFESPVANKIGDDEYRKVQMFLMDNDKFDESCTIETRVRRHDVFSECVAERAGHALDSGDIDTVRKMMSHEEMANSSSDRWAGHIDRYFKSNSKDLDGAVQIRSTLKKALPDNPFHRSILEDAFRENACDILGRDLGRCEDIEQVADVRKRFKPVIPTPNALVHQRAHELSKRDLESCTDFKDVIKQYDRYTGCLDGLSAEAEFYEPYSDMVKKIADSESDLGKVFDMMRTVDLCKGQFREDSFSILEDRAVDIEIKNLQRASDIKSLNGEFGKATERVKERVAGDYYKRAEELIGDGKKDVKALSSEFGSIIWDLPDKSNGKSCMDWRSALTKTYCDTVFQKLKGKSSGLTEALDSVIKTNGISDCLAGIVLSGSGSISESGRYAWLDHFRECPMTGTVAKAISKLNYDIGKDLLTSEPEKALQYLGSVTVENVDGMKVHAELDLAERAMASGDDAAALFHAAESKEACAEMSGPGEAIIVYINSKTEPDEPAFVGAAEMLCEQSASAVLDPELSSIACRYLALAYLSGNYAVSDELDRILESVPSKPSTIVYAVSVAKATERFMAEDYAAAREILASAEASAESMGSELFAFWNICADACRWAVGSGEIGAGDLKSECQSAFGDAEFRMEKWFLLYVQGLIDERQCSYSFAKAKYQEASEFVPDKTAISIKIAEMMMKLNEYSEARNALAGNTDAVSKLMLIWIGLITKANTRPKSELDGMSLDDPYECAFSDYIRGEAELHNRVWKRAAENFAEGIKKLEGSKRRRDVLMRVNLYREHARALLKIDSVTYSSEIYGDYEDAIEMLKASDDSSYEIRVLLEDLVREKDRIDTTDTSRPEPQNPEPSRASRTKLVPMEGMSVIVSGGPLGTGGRYSVYGANVNESRYAFRIPRGLDPYQTKTMNLSRDELRRIDSEVEIWEDLSEDCPDQVVRLIAHTDAPVPSQLMEYAATDFARASASFSFSEKTRAVAEMLDCLSAIHGAGIVHNDIKPENMMLVGDRWKISDFDLSFKQGDEPGRNQGTFQYMSPEHFGRGSVSQASDIWAMGVMLYYALTKRYPFAGEGDNYKASVLEGQYNAGAVSSAYVPLFDKVFSKNAEERPSAADFAAELRKIGEQTEV